MDIKIVDKKIPLEVEYFCNKTNVSIDVYNSLRSFESYIIDNCIFVSIFETKFKHSDKNVLFFGHLNLKENEEDYSKLIHLLKEKTSSNLLVGPIDGSTHNNYRFCTSINSTFSFSGEYILDYKLYEYMIKHGFKSYTKYYSTLNTNLNNLNPKVKKVKARLEKKGLEFLNFEMKYLKDIYEISTEAFKNNIFYDEPSYEEFLYFIKKNESLLNPKLFKLAKFNNEIVGFSFCYHNYLDKSSSSFVGKTIAVKPKYQNLAIGRILAEEILITGKNLGYTSIINAYMHESNESYTSSLFYSSEQKEYELIYWE